LVTHSSKKNLQNCAMLNFTPFGSDWH